jgi:hypothetical protein
MAGPTISVRVLGDVRDFSASMKQVGANAEGVGGRLHAAFSGVLDQLNRSGVLGPFAGALNSIDDGFSRLEEHGHRLGQSMLVLGGVLGGVGLGLTALGSKDQAARQQLQAAIAATGAAWDDYDKQVEAAIKHNERFGDSAAETQNALQILTQATGSPQKALDLLGETADLAAAKHESLTEAATQLGKVYNGSTKLLKEFGITVDNVKGATRDAETATRAAQAADTRAAAAKQRLADLEEIDATRKKLTAAEAIALRNAQQKATTAAAAAVGAHQKLTAAQTAAQKATASQTGAVTQLGNKLAGQASAQSNTFLGHLKAIGTALEDQAAQIGQKYGPQIDFLANSFSVVGGVISVFTRNTKAATAATRDAKVATEELTAASKEATIAMRLQAAAEALADALGLPLIATVGLIVLAVAALVAIGYVLYRNWTTIWKAIKDAAKAVWDWIKTNWPLLLPILLGPVGIAVGLIVKYWHQILDGLKTAWNSVVDFFTGLPAKMANIGKDIFKGILNGFIWVVNKIIDVWNDLHFTLPHVDILGVHIGGETIGVPRLPHIPTLAAGGLITSDGLVYAHAGEAITPLPARLGPAVTVENAHFNSEIDVELFMRKAAWVVQTQGV